MTSPAQGDEAARASAFGSVAIVARDGEPFTQPFFGNANGGLGGPDEPKYVRTSNGVTLDEPGQVKFERSAIAGQTWKVIVSSTVSASVRGHFWRTHNAGADLRYTHSADANGKNCLVESEVTAGDPSDQYVSED